MSLYAVSIALALTGASLQTAGRQQAAQDITAWQQIAPSVVMVMQRGVPRGPAALIDSKGLFIAFKSVIGPAPMFAKTSSGSMIQVTAIAEDKVTQMVLLKAEGWTPAVDQAPLSVISSDRLTNPKSSVKVVALLPSGPIRAELVGEPRMSVVSPSLRAVSVNELRFESPPASALGGALLFSYDGHLVGVLGATLQSASPAGGGGAQVGSRFALETTRAKALNYDANSYGPAGMTVAYTYSPDIMARIVEGFLKPDHQVEYPALGLACTDGNGDGAKIIDIESGSPSAEAGLAKGDIIAKIGGVRIKDQLDYARQLLNQKVGATISVEVHRGADILTLSVKVGRAAISEA